MESREDAFHVFELAAWQRIPEEYDRGFGELTTQAVEPLLDGAAVRAGMAVLDVASGPGYVAAAAMRRGARVTGVDFSLPMVIQARERHPGIDFREGDAESLPFEGSCFDAVVMNFGLLHLARPEQALREAHRVLRPGGRFAATVWATPDRAVAFGMVLRAVEAHGRMDVGLPVGPPFFRYSDAATASRDLIAAGFSDPQVKTIPQRWHLPSEDSLFQVMAGGTARTAGLLRAQQPEALAAIRAAIAREADRYRAGAGIVIPMPAVMCAAAKPG